MAIVINGSGTVTGLSVGGLPDGTVDAGTLATNSVDSAELVDGAVDDSHMASISGRKNILINGDYRISQRGDYTSATSVTNGAYLLDRAKNYLVGVTGTAQQLTNQVVNGTYENTWKYVATSSASGRIGSYQLVEDWYKGETLTLSAWVKSNNANARIVVYDGATNTSSSTHTGGGAWEKLTVTATQSASAGQLYVYSAIISSSVGSVSISSSDYIETAMFQLERGSTATNFEHRSYGEELALCQRYYQFTGRNTVFAGFANGSNQVQFSPPVSVALRASPTISWGEGSGNHTALKYNGYQDGSDSNIPTAINYIVNGSNVHMQLNGFSSNLTDMQITNLYLGGKSLAMECEL